MKYWTILALLVAVFAVFLGVGHAKETTDDFREVALEDVYSDAEDGEQLDDLLMNLEKDDDDETKCFDQCGDVPSGKEDKPEMLKRSPFWRRKRRRRSRRRRFGAWIRRIRDKIRRAKEKVKKFGQKTCRFLQRIKSKTIEKICGFINGDEEFPRVADEGSRFISPEEAHELLKQPGWVLRENNE